MPLLVALGAVSPRQQAPDVLYLVLVNAVAHARIDPLGDPAAEEDGGTGQATSIVARRALRPDQASAQTDHPAIAAGAPRRVFEGEAGALRKAEQHDALGREALDAKPFQQSVQHLQRRGQEGLVACDRREERLRIPTPSARLGR